MCENKNNLCQGQKKIQKYIFSQKKLLGKGSFAMVFLGRQIIDETLVAVKVIEKKIFTNQYNLKSIQSEIQIMKKINNNNIVQLLDVYQTSNNMYLVTQYCPNGDLRTLIKRKDKLSDSQALKYLKNIMNGLKCLSELGIVHRDLKPANILINDGICKIGDFGFAKHLQFGDNTILRSIVGTPLYMSPQILNNQSYTTKSDIWSIGLIYYELIHGYTPWPANNQIQLLNNIMHKDIHFDKSVSQISKDFIKKCLIIKEEDRMSCEQAIRHPLLKKQSNYHLNKLMRIYNDQNQQNQSNRSKSKSIYSRKQQHISRTPNSRKALIGLTPERKRSPWRF